MGTNINYWQDLLKNLPESYRRWFEDEKKYLENHITENSHVLDVGCGDGRNIMDVLEITPYVSGIDHDHKAVLDAQAKLRGYPLVNILQSDALHLPFRDNCFNYLLCIGSFANFAENKYQILREMKRVLDDNGKLLLSVFSEDAFEERMKVYRPQGIIKEIRGTTVVFDESVGDNISEQFTREQLTEFFTQAGFKIEDMRKTSIAYLCKLNK